MILGRSYLTENSKHHLEMGGCDLVKLARKHGTPLYVMDEDLIRDNARSLVRGAKARFPGSDVAYAGKAFLCAWMCEVAAEEGMYLDVASGGELFTAIRAGFPAERIIFHGNNKSWQEILLGVQSGVGRFVLDNYLEIDMVSEAAERANKQVDVLIRIAPGVDAHTHRYIETGMLDSKFGFGLENGEALRAFRRVSERSHLRPRGFHCHIGSQILETTGLEIAARRMVGFAAFLAAQEGFRTEEIDLGGGLGVRYTQADDPPPVDRYLDAVIGSFLEECERQHRDPPRLLLEPGRAVVAEAGVTLYTMGAVKDIPGVRTYISVDGGMTDNPRPALYGAVYEAVLANRPGDPPTEAVAIAGKSCESGDIVIQEARLPASRPGDILCVLTTGAYAYSMASNYNRLPRPAVVTVSKGRSRVVVRRETYEDVVSKDVLGRKTVERLLAAARARDGEGSMV